MMKRGLIGAAVLSLALAMPFAAASGDAPADYRARPPQDEVVYFVLPDRFANGDPKNDRGGLKGDRLKTGFDPAAKGFYHGGDLKGLTQHLDYIQGLGATAVWFAPVFRNKPVQGPKGDESAGYHGYWITDFTSVDPHFGTNAEFKAFVDAAHARGMKVYMDIVVNHTADVIQYREGGDYLYRGKGDYPFSRRGGAKGAAINSGFGDDSDSSATNWLHMTDPSFAYTPYVPKGEEHAKTPAWLNDPIWYHNRGNSNWQGESAQYGDFSGLDDLATENPRVVQGFIEIYSSWIDRFGIDGFRIDTAKHVNPEFWRAFVPAMLAKAKANGIPNFHIFGEVASSEFEPALQAEWTRNAGLPATLDFAFAFSAVTAASGSSGTQQLARLIQDDVLYEGGAATALIQPTFLGNHDAGRVGMFLSQFNPKADAEELLARDMLAHAMMLTMRGVPVIYSGDEQGFVGHGGDQLSRQDMFASKVAVYNDQSLLGSTRTTAADNFNPQHPLYKLIAELSAVRRSTPALTSGKSVVRLFSDNPGLFVLSRFDPVTGREVVIAFNTANEPRSAHVPVAARSLSFAPLVGQCSLAADAPGSFTVTLAPLGFAVCAAKD
jgi:neopullulanase